MIFMRWSRTPGFPKNLSEKSYQKVTKFIPGVPGEKKGRKSVTYGLVLVASGVRISQGKL
jgi:hypothetical protein